MKIVPSLSVCIPTYNRASKLRNLLLELQKCSTALGDQIEVLVSDNCSSDTTEEVVGALSHNFPIKYFRQNVNTGPTSNYLFLLGKATGTYCWVTGDDDLIFVDEIISFVNFIKSQPIFSLFVVDTQLALEKLAKLPHEGCSASICILFSILRRGLYPFGHYTCLVFNTNLLHKLIADIGDSEADLGFWPHQFFLLSILWNSSLSGYIYPSPLAMQGAPSCGEIMSIITWLDIEANRLSVISSPTLQISSIFKFIFVARELFSFRISKLLILLSVISPGSRYPFIPNRQKKNFLDVPYKLLFSPPYYFYSMSSLFFTILNKYFRLYIRLCLKYGICPESAAQIDSERYIINM